jgi:transketolase
MLNSRSKKIRLDAIELADQYGGTHFGGSMSCAEILIALYDYVLTENDIFILSKGHSCWAYYVILREKGFNPIIESHPHIDISNGINCTTGSLGHGLPFGLGIAMAKKIKNEDGKVFILLGDGECQEGTLWESLLVAAANNLDNVCVIVDKNTIQGSGFVDSIAPISNLNKIATLCGWNSHTIDGHDVDQIIDRCRFEDGPAFIIANTIKGKGISFMENNVEWHSKVLNQEFKNKAKEELR